MQNETSIETINTPRSRERMETATEKLGLNSAEAQTLGPFVEHLHPVGVRDFVGVLSLDPDGHAIWLGAPTGATKRPSRQVRAAWSRIAVHISAGARLRRRAASCPGSDPATGSDAVLSKSVPSSTRSRAPKAYRPANRCGGLRSPSTGRGPKRAAERTRLSTSGRVWSLAAGRS